MSAKITLGGFTVLGALSVTWRFRAGSTPVIEEFDLAPDDVKALIDGSGQPITLIIDVPGISRKLEVKNLWVLSEGPSANPRLRRVRVADRRWLWDRIHIVRRYNMRRRVGFFRIETPEVLELQRVEEDIWYARYSLRDPAAGSEGVWRSDEVLVDVFRALLEAEKQITGFAPELTVKTEDVQFLRNIPIENLEIDDNAQMATQRVVAYFPELNFYLNADGDVVLFSKATAFEESLIAQAGPEIIGGGHIEFIRRDIERPRAIDVLFSYEVELRFDFLQASDFATGVVNDESNLDALRLKNVMPVPDFSFFVFAGGGQDVQLVPQGTFLTFDLYMKSLDENAPGIDAPIDHNLLQSAFVPFNDLWAALLLLGERDTDVDWAARIAAFQRHYLQTFQINTRWMDRILSIRPYRVSTTSTELGSRAPAEAYSDHAIMGSQRSFFRDASAGGNLQYAINVFGYPQGDGEAPFPFAPNQRPSPAIVSISDHDQGIVRLDYQGDPYRVYEIFLPGAIENMPNGDLDRELSERLQSGLPGNPLEFSGLAFDAITESIRGQALVLPKLKGEAKVAVVLTAIPAAPNNVRQLYRVRVEPDDVRDGLPPAMRFGLSAARGPVMEVRIQPSVETARVAWKDDRENDIKEIFGVLSEDEPETEEEEQGEGSVPKTLVERIEDLVINRSGDIAGAASLDAISRAVAARVWASFADHSEGSATYNMNPQLEPGGWAEEVAHAVSPEGVATTTFTLPEQLPTLDWLSLADGGSRAIIMRLALKSAGQ